MNTKQWVNEKGRAEIGPHVDAFVLADYADGLLEDVQEKEVRDHLVACKACADEYLALTAPLGFDPKPSDPPLNAQSWEALVAMADRAKSHEVEPARLDLLRRPGLTLSWLATAAALILAAWLWMDQPTPAAHPATTELNLLPLNEATRGSEAKGDAEALLVLRLSFTEPTTAPVFEIAVLPEGGAPPRWSSTVNRQSDGTFLVSFEPGYFSPGRYQLQLKGGNDLLATYEFSVSKP